MWQQPHFDIGLGGPVIDDGAACIEPSHWGIAQPQRMANPNGDMHSYEDKLMVAGLTP